VQVQGGKVVMAILEAGSAASFMVRNPWPGQPAVVVDGAMSTTIVGSTTASTFTIPTLAGHWYAIVPASVASALPTVQVTGSPASAKKVLGPVSIGL